MRTNTGQPADQARDLPVPVQGPSAHPSVFDHAGFASARAPARVALRYLNGVGTRDFTSFVAQWLACGFRCRRFATTLTDSDAGLGADAVRYSFIVTDFYRPIFADLLAHSD